MLDFILSKLNLLILAVSVFGIISFFTLGMIEKSTYNESGLLLSRLERKSEGMANSPAYCDSFRFSLPSSIAVSGDEFFYVIKISTQKRRVEEKDVTEVIFSFIPRKDFKRNYNTASAITAQHFLTPDEVVVYGFEVESLNAPEWSSPKTNYFGGNDELSFVDPQASTPFDTIYFVKRIVEGKPYFIIIPCNSGVCDAVKLKASDDFWTNLILQNSEIESLRPSGGFGC